MRRFYFSLVAALIAMTTAASAQFVQNEASTQPLSNNNAGNIFSSMTTENYNRIYVGYNPVKMNWEKYQSDWEDSFPIKNGVTLGYLHGSNITKNLPLYLEWGANFQYIFGKYSDSYSNDYGEYSETTKVNMFSLNVPINLAFRFSFNNNDLSITPYLGLNFRVNLAGNRKYEWEEDEDGYYEEESETLNIFSSKDFEDDGMSDYAFKRFQAGLNLGVGLTYKSVYVGVGHVIDFSKIANYEDEDFVGKLGVTTISLGIAF